MNSTDQDGCEFASLKIPLCKLQLVLIGPQRSWNLNRKHPISPYPQPTKKDLLRICSLNHFTHTESKEIMSKQKNKLDLQPTSGIPRSRVNYKYIW